MAVQTCKLRKAISDPIGVNEVLNTLHNDLCELVIQLSYHILSCNPIPSENARNSTVFFVSFIALLPATCDVLLGTCVPEALQLLPSIMLMLHDGCLHLPLIN